MGENQGGFVAALAAQEARSGTLSTSDCEWVLDHHEEATKLFVMAIANRPRPVLRFLRRVQAPAVPRFVAELKFREGEAIDGIKVVRVGQCFRENLLEKVEENVPALELREHVIDVLARDPVIIAEIGENEADTFLAHLWDSLKTADHRLSQVRYVRDAKGVLWAVHVYWREDGIDINACRPDRDAAWSAKEYETHVVSL